MTILSEIERDLRAFADPWSPVVVDKTSAVWEKSGKEMSIRFTASKESAFPDVIVDDHRMPYREFLASPSMADLRRFAEFITKTHSKQEEYIDTIGTLHNVTDDTTKRGFAAELVRTRATEELPFLSTRVLLVRGEAGSGKTVSLREASARQASLFLSGKARSLFFLVDAQGRALSRLEDAMAKDLQDLRAGFSYAAVAPLTRHNLLIPIIDGFDELLGSGGYDEAFSSLAAFLATLDGNGAVVASARSAFFDYRNFYDNAQRFSADGRLNYEVDTLRVEPWDLDQIRAFVTGYARRRVGDPEALVAAFIDLVDNLDDSNRQLLSKPFYASRVAELLATGDTVRGGKDLLDQLVDAFIDREQKKLLDKEGRPLLSAKGHLTFLTALAEEMWWQENRRLDVGTVQVAAELITEAFALPPTAAQAIVERVSSYAFLASDSSSRRALRFEHEVFYNYFLAHKLREYIEKEPADLRRFIARAVVEPTLVDQSVRLIGADSERCSRAIEAITSVLRPQLSEIIARENAGTLISGLLRSARTPRSGLGIRHAVFRQLQFGPLEARELLFDSCDFSEVDFSDVLLVKPGFRNTALRNITVDLTSTRFDGLPSEVQASVYGVIVRSERPGLPSGKVFAPDDIARILMALGMETPLVAPETAPMRPKKIDERIDVLERFLMKMERRFYASEDDIRRFPFTKKAEWEEVHGLLMAHDLLQPHAVQKSGPQSILYRLSVPPDIVRRGEDTRDPKVPSSVRAFWRDLVRS